MYRDQYFSSSQYQIYTKEIKYKPSRQNQNSPGLRLYSRFRLVRKLKMRILTAIY